MNGQTVNEGHTLQLHTRSAYFTADGFRKLSVEVDSKRKKEKGGRK